MTEAEINDLITEKILTGGSQTRAVGTREILNAITASYLNKEEGGTVEALLTYSSAFAITSATQLVHRQYVTDAIAGITVDFFPLAPVADVIADFGNTAGVTFDNMTFAKFFGTDQGDFEATLFQNATFTGSDQGDFAVSAYDNVSFEGNNSGNFSINNYTAATVGGTPGVFAGLQYVADYSAQYTSRSLVDKAYADGLIGGQWSNTGNAYTGAVLGTSGGFGDWGLIRNGVELMTFATNGIRFQNAFGQPNTGSLYYIAGDGRILFGADNASTSGGPSVGFYGMTGGTILGVSYLDNSMTMRQYNGSFVYDAFMVANGGNILLGTTTGHGPGARLDIETFSSSDANIAYRITNSAATVLFQVSEGGEIKMNQGGDATGDIYYRDGSGVFKRLAIGTAGQVLTVAAGLPSWVTSGAGVTSVSGTLNRITSTGGATPIIDISAAYIGQTSITTLGTITTGTLGSGTLVLLGSDATGDMYYNGGAGALTRLGIGAAGTVLTGGATPSYATIPSILGYTPMNQGGDTMTGLLILSADPVAALGAATKSYVDNLLTGITWKQAVTAATTANITLSGPQAIDGVGVIAGDRVLVKNQTAPEENGIYLCAAGAWTRTTDADTGVELAQATVLVEDGTVAASTQWNCSNTTITIGVTAVTFVQIAGAGVYTAGTGLQLIGNAFSIDATVVTLTGAQALTNKTGNISQWTNDSSYLTAATGVTTVNGASGAITNVALTTGNLSQFASTTSAQLAALISNETGSGVLVFGTSPSFTTSVIGSATMAVFNTTSTVITAFGAATTMTVGGTPTSAVTHNYSNNATLTAVTKTINFGTGGASGSTTAITFGSSTPGAINSIRMNITPTSDATGDMFYRNSSAFLARLAIGSAGQVLTVSGGLPVWATPSSSSPTYQFSLMGQASSTTGYFTKASDAGSTANPSGKETTSGVNDYVNGGVDPHIVHSAATSALLRIVIAGGAVSTGTVGTPVIKFRLYKTNYTGRTQIGTDFDITLSATGIGTFNNVAGNAFQTAISSAVAVAISAGDLIGIEFVNVSGSNNAINAISRCNAVLILS